MPCSPVTLSIATIASVISVALLSIAFSTDNWVRISVDRNSLQQNLTQLKARAVQRGETPDPELLKLEKDDNILAFTRTKGLFRICFPEQRPKDADLYRSPVETYCKNIDYYLSGESTTNFSENSMSWLHMGRSMIALFIISFLFTFLAFWTGIAGCWRRSPGNITATALLMLLSCLFSAGGMGLWHGVEYFEREKLTDPEFYKQWPEILQNNTRTAYDWSFMLAWISVGLSLLASIFLFLSSCCMRREIRDEITEHIAAEPITEPTTNLSSESALMLQRASHYDYDWSYMIAWIGVGWALIASILFSGAAICLRNEREKEEALNMQYLMPVYPQKQQYAYGYAYPGPYYPGSQPYTPYNY